MAPLLSLIDRMPLLMVVILCATLGLAPMLPEPHIWEKLKMLVNGTLVRPIDIFDLLFHAAPWALLLVKLLRMARAS